MAEIVPVDKGSKEASFEAIARDFNLSDKVFKLLMNSNMESLEDFRFYFAEEKHIDDFLAQDDSLKDTALRLQVSRLRRAWSAVRQHVLRKEARQTPSTTAELDDLLAVLAEIQEEVPS